MKKVISRSNGVTQTLHVDDADGYRGAVELSQDVEGVLREVHRAREQPVGRELRKVAEIPMAVYVEACANGHANDPEFWKRWFNNPDNAEFRVHGKRL